MTVNQVPFGSGGATPSLPTKFYKIVLDILFNLCYNSIIEREKRMIEIRECPIHGETEFVFVNSGKRWRCKKCRLELVQIRRYHLKDKAIDYKGGKCEVCGYDKCKEALEFHHLDPSQKDFGIGSDGCTRSWEKVKEELDKCICVCANCHREIHSKEWNIKKNNLLKIHNYSGKYDNDIDVKIVYMKDVENKSFYQISKELNINRNTVMTHYHKYKKENIGM